MDRPPPSPMRHNGRNARSRPISRAQRLSAHHTNQAGHGRAWRAIWDRVRACNGVRADRDRTGFWPDPSGFAQIDHHRVGSRSSSLSHGPSRRRLFPGHCPAKLLKSGREWLVISFLVRVRLIARAVLPASFVRKDGAKVRLYSRTGQRPDIPFPADCRSAGAAASSTVGRSHVMGTGGQPSTASDTGP